MKESQLIKELEQYFEESEWFGPGSYEREVRVENDTLACRLDFRAKMKKSLAKGSRGRDVFYIEVKGVAGQPKNYNTYRTDKLHKALGQLFRLNIPLNGNIKLAIAVPEDWREYVKSYLPSNKRSPISLIAKGIQASVKGRTDTSFLYFIFVKKNGEIETGKPIPWKKI